MAEAITYQCPNCMGKLSFDSASGRLACEFCGSDFDPVEIEQRYAERQAAADAKAQKDSGVAEAAAAAAGAAAIAADSLSGTQFAPPAAEAIIDASAPAAAAAPASRPTAAEASVSMPEVVVQQGAAGEDPIAVYLKNAKWENIAEEDLRAFNCSSCGAQLMVDQVTAVTQCPYCGNAGIVPGQLADVLKPDFIIPFKVSREQAIAALKNYYKGKKLLSDNFKDQNHIEEIQGVYVPFWLYSGTAHASVQTEARNTRAWSDAHHNHVEVDHFRVYREGDMSFHRVPVDGSTKMPDAHMDSIEPFDYSELVPFSVGYLPGYLADRYDLDVKDCHDRAGNRVQATCGEALINTIVGYDGVDKQPATAQLNLNEVAYALLPVWMLHTRWNDQDFLFAMNGQTGKFVGDLPVDKGKAVTLFLLIFIPLAVLIFIIVLITMGFGM